MRQCIRCGQEIYLPHWESNVCGSCADELRPEEDAMTAQAEAEDDAIGRAAYEEAQHDAHFDTGNGYRYI